jgi:hypothetical protein
MIRKYALSLLATLALCSPRLYADDFVEPMQRQNEIDSLRQDIRDTQAEIESANIRREWNDMAAAEDARRQAEQERQQEQAQWQDMMNAKRQQMNPLVQPDTGTDSLVKELRDLKDEIEQSRLDADFRQYQAAFQARLAAMTPEERAAYWEAQQLASEKARANAIQAEVEKKAQEEEVRYHDPFPYPPHKWDHQTQFGKTFAIIKFRERKAGIARRSWTDTQKLSERGSTSNGAV